MSLKDIANEAGTSIATVSRVLSSKTETTNNKELYEKIWEIAARQNYVVNDSARRLRKGNAQEDQVYTVDIFLTRFDFLDTDPFFREIYECIRKDLLAEKCVIGELLSSEDIMSMNEKTKKSGNIPYRKKDRIDEVSESKLKKNRGLIILGKCPQNMIDMLHLLYGQIVGIDRNPTEFLYDEVICNGTAAAMSAVEYLINMKHKNIAYIGDCTYEARYIGYCRALMNHHLPLSHGSVFPTSQTREEGGQMMLKILDMKERPSAIFCANDATALGVLDTLKKHRRKGYIPSVISIDNIVASEKSSPMLTTIDIPKAEMSHLAIMLLLDRRKNSHKKYVRLELPYELIVRESCYYAAE